LTGQKQIEINVCYVTLLLASVAGFCDTITFVAANQVFSAHVTGNFIVFAYDVISGSDGRGWIKLITLPVFIISVITGGWLIEKASGKYSLLLAESVLLILGGLIALVFRLYGIDDLLWPSYVVVTLVVFAMGLQNAFGKVFSKETLGPTTIMTGNVTQVSLDIGTLLRSKFKDEAARLSLKKLMVNIGGFLGGCLFGAILGKQVGLSAVVLPGLGLLHKWAILNRYNNNCPGK